MHHRTTQRPHLSELQRSEPNGWLTWLGHQTVSGGAPDCPVRHAITAFQRSHFGGWGYKYPNHPTFNGIQVFHLQHITRAIAFNSRHNQRDQILSQVRNHSKSIVTRESDLLVFFRALALGLLSSFLILSLQSNSLVIEARDTKLVVVLAGTLCSK